MEKRAFYLRAKRNGDVRIRVIPGHFATKHSHVNYCIDMTQIKSELKMARAATRLFADDFSFTPVDTIMSFERMKMIGAFLARDLSHTGINQHQDIAVLSPEITDGKMLLRDNFLPYIKGKRVLVLTASASTGMTVARIPPVRRGRPARLCLLSAFRLPHVQSGHQGGCAGQLLRVQQDLITTSGNCIRNGAGA